jgi:SAM-dependent methyltransferase
MRLGSTNARVAAWSVFDLAEGFYLANALVALDRHGILQALGRHPTAARVLAVRHRVDCGVLESTLQILAARTDLIAERSHKYHLTHKYDAYARFIVSQYLRTYSGNALALDRTLTNPTRAAHLIDRRQHPIAFDDAPALSSIMLGKLIVQLDLNHVLDLGCGTGIMLANLASGVAKFVGWGMDASSFMCAAARRRVTSAPAGISVKIIRGDCYDPKASISTSIISQVQTITAASVANEFFAEGTKMAVKWLTNLRKTFPGRTLLIADYYGRLGHGKRPWAREIVLHDFVQVISGQGVPPPALRAWKRIYRASGCTLVHAIEDSEASCFVHVLRL